VQHFSNPDVLFNGQPTGIAYSQNPAASADNARSISQASYTVANWRDSSTRRPAAPSGLVAVAQSPTEIDLSWQDNATGETGYEVQRRIEGQAWAAIINLGANATGYQDQGLAADTAYQYRVRAYTASESSDFSNVAEAITPRFPELHVGDLSGGGAVESGDHPASITWRGVASIQVHDAYHQPVNGATVSGQWSGGASGDASCLTDSSGFCSMIKAGLGPDTASVTFSISDIDNGGDPYLPGHNHAPYGDGTTITIAKPVGALFLPRVNRGS
jgi:hypothetical protein